MSTARYGWRKDTPPVNQVVEVWREVTIILAYWTGAQWRTADGSPLGAVCYWRAKQ